MDSFLIFGGILCFAPLSLCYADGILDKRKISVSKLPRTSRKESFQLAFSPWQPDFMTKELYWLWKVLELKPSAKRDPGARPYVWRPGRRAEANRANEKGRKAKWGEGMKIAF